MAYKSTSPCVTVRDRIDLRRDRGHAQRKSPNRRNRQADDLRQLVPRHLLLPAPGIEADSHDVPIPFYGKFVQGNDRGFFASFRHVNILRTLVPCGMRTGGTQLKISNNIRALRTAIGQWSGLPRRSARHRDYQQVEKGRPNWFRMGSAHRRTFDVLIWDVIMPETRRRWGLEAIPLFRMTTTLAGFKPGRARVMANCRRHDRQSRRLFWRHCRGGHGVEVGVGMGEVSSRVTSNGKTRYATKDDARQTIQRIHIHRKFISSASSLNPIY